ncbi:glycoside hydrolase family 97 C-terminal domain-containing protein [Sphingomonas cavernae]|uniref:glycoside hydrolase family 97 C-terminal domain-containing protein n=1 Tax=Sphingomonas cavernae TaxID=2320861 RepID=UPI003B75BEDD
MVKLPTSWDETRVLEGSVGYYITVARPRGKEWYIGSMADNSARELTIALSFICREHSLRRFTLTTPLPPIGRRN